MKSAQHIIAAALILDAATTAVANVLHRPKYKPVTAQVLFTPLSLEMVRMTAEFTVTKLATEKKANLSDNETLRLLESTSTRCAESALNLLMLVHDRHVKGMGVIPMGEGTLALLEKFVADTSGVGAVIYPGRADREAVDELIKLGAVRRDLGMPPAGQPTYTIAV